MITNYGNAYSSILVEIRQMLGISEREHLELTKRMFELAYTELHENIFWSTGARKIVNFTLKPGETIGGGCKFNECNKNKPAFDVNLTLHKDFKIITLIDENDKIILKEGANLRNLGVYSYLLLEKDSCKEIYLNSRKQEKKYKIEFIDAGVVACSESAENVPVGLDSLDREFLVYETALKLSVRLNMDLGKNFEMQYAKVKTRLMTKTKFTVRSNWSKIPI